MKIGLVIAFLLIIIILSVNVFAKVDHSTELKCKKQCLAEKKFETKLCLDNSNWELFNCNYLYKECVFNVKNSVVKSKQAKEIKSCINKNSICSQNTRYIKKQCYENVSNSFDNCNSYCNLKTCPNETIPVCGIDGNTYINECFMLKAGVEKSYDGACTRFCYSDNDCKSNEYCQEYEGSCLWNNNYLIPGSLGCYNTNSLLGCLPNIGTCIKTPDLCKEDYEPVCGCDGKTYSNNCKLESNKISKAYDGSCVDENCSILSNQIQNEIDNSIKCEKDSDCVIGFLGAPCNFIMCGSAYNLNSNLTALYDLSDRYNKACRSVCPLYMCRDPYSGKPKCNNNKCEIEYTGIII